MPGFTQIPNEYVFDDPLWTSEKMTKGQAYADYFGSHNLNHGW